MLLHPSRRSSRAPPTDDNLDVTTIAHPSTEFATRDHFDTLAATGYWAGLYAEHTDPRIRWSFLRRQAILESLLDAAVRPSSLVVEIGPGTGNLIPFLATKRCRYRGFDVADSMVAATQSQIAKSFARNADARCEKGDIYSIPVESRCADVIVAAGVIEYLQDPKMAAAELARIARPGAMALISVPNAASLNRKLGRALSFITTATRAAKRLTRRNTKASDVERKCYTPTMLKNLFEPADWKLDRTEYYDVEPIPYPINRLASNLAFAAKRRAESSQAAPRAILANAFVAQFAKGD